MVLRYYPTKDATLYEDYSERNTGLDAILEINKIVVGSSSYNSRAVIDFDYASISASIVSLGYNPNNFTYNLKLFVSDANEIPTDYSLYCHPLSNDWSMGVGRYGNSPQTTDGVSWAYRRSSLDLATSWQTASFTAGTTGSWTTTAGGGNWYTGSVASQSFSYTTADLNIDVTNIIRQVQSGSISFNGFILKKSPTDESSANTFKSLKFFSKDTHTVYSPILEAKYDDSIVTGSLTAINTDEDFNIIAVNLKPSYSEKSTPTLRISARYRFPALTFATQSEYVVRYTLPTGSQYAIYSAQSDDAIINFSEFTKISADNTSNYIKLHLDSFQPERYYRLLLKVPQDSGYNIYDGNWIFKVTRLQ
jgi:hypothetical protein